MNTGKYVGRDAEILFRDKNFRFSLNSFVSTSSISFITNTGSYTLKMGDRGKMIFQNSGSVNNLTVPNNDVVNFPIGTQIHVSNMGTGQTSIVAASGVTINSPGGALKLRVQYSSATLIKTGINTWLLTGDITV